MFLQYKHKEWDEQLFSLTAKGNALTLLQEGLRADSQENSLAL